MRRRGTDFRRPARRKFLSLLWFFICSFVLLLFMFFLRQDGLPVSTPLLTKVTYRGEKKVNDGVNITEEMVSPHSTIRQVTDQIALAKAMVVIAKENNNLNFAWELSAQIRVSHILLSEMGTRRTPLATIESETAIRDMALLLLQARQLYHYDSASTIAKLKATIHSLEDQLNSITTKSSKYSQIAAEEVPKGLYCLGLRLTMEWIHSGRGEVAEKAPVEDGDGFLHFCIFSDNVLATSVVVNSTAVNSMVPERVVFHLVTDELNYPAMKAWFSTNQFRGVRVRVQKMEELEWLNSSYVPVLRQLQSSETRKYYFTGKGEEGMMSPIKFRNPKYLSMLNHLRFYIPEVYPGLKKVVFLDDDVVVQRDLSALFRVKLEGNVNGAVETCMETFHRYHKYLNFSHPLVRAHFDPDACGWAFGMNVFDLEEWRRRNVTGVYHYWQEMNVNRTLWKLGTLPPGLLTFYGLTKSLDPEWHVLGLGYTNVDAEAIHKGAVLHFNGNLKPWLKIGMEKYKPLWDRYVDYSHPLLQQCNVG